ncbi:MAG: bile acid:sodium symporter family protein [Cyclobacteriaceae bacterium]|nr:bile acid:sodium symporter family protein [Cyclobacteriaceae bacterium]
MARFYPKLLIILAGLFLAGYIFTTTQQAHSYAGWMLMAFFGLVALAFRQYEVLKGYAFTITIFAAVSLAMYYPQYFVYAGDFKLSKLIVPLMQLLMFGMGTALSLQDFSRVLKMPKGVLVGIACQFSIMPFVGWTLTKVFSFPPEIAAGVILIGSCPSGLASNVMSYLAKANLALSVTLTAVATLMAPLMTPLLMKLLAGQYVSIDFWSMVWDITKIIILPIGAGLIFHHFLRDKFKMLDTPMPIISMASIALIITIITAAGRNDLLVVGPLLILAALIHNLSGYFLGYWSARVVRMSEQDCRTVALEVGLQNGGLASSLALSMGKLATVGLASAVFAPIMNITGSSLALWWRSKTDRQLPSENT